MSERTVQIKVRNGPYQSVVVKDCYMQPTPIECAIYDIEQARRLLASTVSLAHMAGYCGHDIVNWVGNLQRAIAGTMGELDSMLERANEEKLER